jgi:shikimate dehydrogenase
MHNAAFGALDMDYAYVAFDVDPSNLKSAIDGARALNIKGFNVTIPHKIEIMEFLDEIDEVAGLIGAVNTIDFKEMKGYNTDGIGAVKAIEEVSSIRNRNVVVAGAGGASRAISFYIAKYGADKLTILNRNVEKAQSLAGDVSDSGLMGDVGYDSIFEISSYLEDADILIDTTPLGMHPNIGDEPVALAGDMHEDLVVFDAVYNPNETVLIKQAIKAGAKPVYGIKMLLYQGAESFRIWTGHDAPVEVMEDALKKTLNLG